MRNEGEAYLGSKEESQVTATSTAAASSETILNLQRNFLRKTKLYLARQSSGLTEVDEILEREGESDGLGELDRHVFAGILDVGVLADGHRTVTNVSLAGEFDALFCSLDDDCGNQN